MIYASINPEFGTSVLRNEDVPGGAKPSLALDLENFTRLIIPLLFGVVILNLTDTPYVVIGPRGVVLRV